MVRPSVRLFVVAASGVCLLLSAGCAASARSNVTETPRQLRLATGRPDGVFHTIGSALAVAYRRQNVSVWTSPRTYQRLERNLDDVERGGVDLAFVDSEAAYVAYRHGTRARPKPHVHVRAIAVLFPTVVHVFSTRRSGVVRPSDLRSSRIAVGERNGYADQMLATIAAAYDLDPARVSPVFGPTTADRMSAERIDGALFFTPVWHRSVADVVTNGNVQLLSLDRRRIARIQTASERNHFLKSTTIPRGTYPGQDHDVLTIGDDILLVCRDDLPEELVYNLTRILFESRAELTRAHPAARAIDVDRGATASIPLHPGAVRYYRERDLPR